MPEDEIVVKTDEMSDPSPVTEESVIESENDAVIAESGPEFEKEDEEETLMVPTAPDTVETNPDSEPEFEGDIATTPEITEPGERHFF